MIATQQGVCAVRFDPHRFADGELGGPLAADAAEQLRDYLDGTRTDFDLPLDWRGVKGARKGILLELLKVTFGFTASYGELAERAGMPGAAQLVGQVLASNPIPVLVPCHRVTRSGGGLSGFAGARRAVEIKAWLLAHEGARLL